MKTTASARHGILPYLKFVGIKFFHFQRIEILQNNSIPNPSGRKGQVIGQRKIDMIHKLHFKIVNGVINHRLRQFKVDRVRLGGKANNISRYRLVLQNKDLLNLTFLKLIPYGFVIADSLSHENGLLSRVVQSKNKRIVQHLNYTHVITSSPRLS